MNVQSISEHEIVSYYDTCHIDYQLVWHLNSEKSLHYGYWRENTRNLRHALQNMNQLVIEAADVEPSHRVLDAGCGIGGTSIYLAQKIPCQVEGITLSANQVQKATNLAGEYPLKGEVRFSVQDFCRSEFPDASFDRVFGIESVCHANEKKDFLKEAYRLLKKGGKLVVSDFFRNKTRFDEKDEHLIMKWAKSWAVPDFEDYSIFEQKAREVGFNRVVRKDITQNIKRSSRRLYYCFFPGLAVHHILRVLGMRNRTHEANVWSTYYQYKALNRKLWSYQIFEIDK